MAAQRLITTQVSCTEPWKLDGKELLFKYNMPFKVLIFLVNYFPAMTKSHR